MGQDAVCASPLKMGLRAHKAAEGTVLEAIMETFFFNVNLFLLRESMRLEDITE